MQAQAGECDDVTICDGSMGLEFYGMRANKIKI